MRSTAGSTGEGKYVGSTMTVMFTFCRAVGSTADRTQEYVSIYVFSYEVD